MIIPVQLILEMEQIRFYRMRGEGGGGGGGGAKVPTLDVAPVLIQTPLLGASSRVVILTRLLLYVWQPTCQS